mmetsp:Transcript_8435/g.14127  ORF Transcript_8435/g.14127 Transcript_8435/m.14127 type:complete len:106 (+) Transcript_8435:208-525(+)
MFSLLSSSSKDSFSLFSSSKKKNNRVCASETPTDFSSCVIQGMELSHVDRSSPHKNDTYGKCSEISKSVIDSSDTKALQARELVDIELRSESLRCPAPKTSQLDG